MYRITSWLLLIFIILVGAGCQRDDEKNNALQSSAIDEAVIQVVSESLAAAQVKNFRLTEWERQTLDAAVAENILGTVNGYFTNQEGVSGYFEGYERPFNFIWTGETTEEKAFDGHVYQVLDGPGELVVKYQDDLLALQRVTGDFKNGLWHGYSDVWQRNGELGGHNYFHYRGSFIADQMEGRGIYTDYNCNGANGHPYQYEGGFKNNSFHGHGLATDLATGEMVYKGFWFEGQRAVCSEDLWRDYDECAELTSADRQYVNVLMTGRIAVDGVINNEPGKGPLRVILPEEFHNARLEDDRGRVYALEPVEYQGRRNGGWGCVADVPEYPLTLTASYEFLEIKHFFRITIKRPFTLVLGDQDLNRPEAAFETDMLTDI